MNAIYKFVMAQLAKRGGKTGLPTIQSGKGLNVEFSVKQIEQTLKDMGVDVSKITSPKEVEKFLNIQQSWLNQQVKQKAKNIGLMDPNKNIFMKKGPFEGFTPKVVPKPENIMGGMEGIKARNTKIQDLAAQLAKMQKEKSAMYGKTDIVTDTVTKIKTMEPVAALKEANSVIGRKGIYKNLTKEQSQKILKDTDDWIFQRDPDDLYDYNKKRPFRDDPDVDPEDFAGGGIAGMLGEPTYADGGRVPLGGGKLVFDAARRKFLEMMGGAAATGVAAKTGLFGLLKAGKPAAKIADVTSVPIGSAEGMPAWFKPLVNKVIREGEDVTKKFATADREIVHQISLEGKMSKDALGVEDIRVTQSLDDGTIRVEYNSPNTIGESGVELTYTKGEIIPTKKGSVKTKDEFTAAEDDYYPQATSPDGDFDIEITENIVNKVDDLYSDTSKLKQFATGKNPTIKEISESMKKKKILEEIEKNPNDHAFRNVPDADWDDSLDFASGGRVPLSGGGGGGKKVGRPKGKTQGTGTADLIDLEWDDLDPYEWLEIIKAARAGDYGAAEGGRVPMVFGGPTTGVLKNLLTKMKKSSGIGRGKKSLKPDKFAKSIMTAEDKLKLLQIETKYANSILESLKIDRQLFKHLETNKAKKDAGLDFLMKHFVDTQTPHMKNYKSLADIDNAILELETFVKNKTLKEGRKLNATGGRVSLSKGKLVDFGFKFLNRIFGKDRMIEMRTRDPEMYQGLLEVVEKFRGRDKAGLIKYMKKYLPHMDDAEIEDFIIGGHGTEGIHGQLIRLGSGRDYQGKIDMIKKFEQQDLLRSLDAEKATKHATGGLAGMLGE